MHLTGMSKVCFSWLLLYTLILKLVFDPGLLKAALGIYSFFFSFLFFSIFFFLYLSLFLFFFFKCKLTSCMTEVDILSALGFT